MIGFTGGEIPTVKVNRLLLNNVDVVGVGWGAWSAPTPTTWPSSGPSSSRCWRRARLSAPEPVTYPLDRAGEAIASLENRTAKGKVVLRVR